MRTVRMSAPIPRSGLSKELTDTLEALCGTRVFEKNEIIYRQGEDACLFYYLKKGSVCVYSTSSGGGERILSTVGGGSVLGEASFFDGQPRISSARAQTKCLTVPVDRDALLNVISCMPHTAMELLRLQASTIRMLSHQVDSMTFIDAKGRIAQFLLTAAGDGNTVCVTHEEIAGAVGVSRVTVSKLMTRLASEGIIRTGYRCVELIDKKGLEELSHT